MPVAASTEPQRRRPDSLAGGSDRSADGADNSPILLKRQEVSNNVGCVSLSQALEQATESLTLEAESSVRSTIQGSIRDDAFKEAALYHPPFRLFDRRLEVIRDMRTTTRRP
jgi:hypothetical protein